MSGAYLNANGFRITDLDLAIPYYGAAVADVVLSAADALVSPVTLTVGNLVLAMAVGVLPNGSPAQRTFAGTTTARLVGGKGGWRSTVSLTPYKAPTGSPGVLLSRVLTDVAARCKEAVNVQADRYLGPIFAPEPNAQGGRILTLLAGSLWWIDVSGVTQVAASRPTFTIGTRATLEEVNGGKGWVRVATEDPASWLPGASYSDALQSFSVAATRIHASNDGTARVEVLAA